MPRPNRNPDRPCPADRIAMAVLLAVTLIGLTACNRQVVAVDNPVEIDPAEYSRMYRASIQVLRDYGFRIDRQDHRFGVVSTEPLDAPTALEVWQPTNSTTGQAIEGTLHHERRIVAVTLAPPENFQPTADADAPLATPDHYNLSVAVNVERFEDTTRRFTGSTAGRQTVGRLRGVPAEMQERDIPRTYWRPLARDTALEKRLLADIIRAAVRLTDDPAFAPAPGPGSDQPAPAMETAPPDESAPTDQPATSTAPDETAP